MKKIAAVILVMALAACSFLGIPSLFNASLLSREELKKRLDGADREALTEKWGEPWKSYSGFNGDLWLAEDQKVIGVLFNSRSGKAGSVAFSQSDTINPDFSFTIRWGHQGENGYSSKDRLLYKGDPQNTMEFELEEEVLYAVWQIASALCADYPDRYDPHSYIQSDPGMDLYLEVSSGRKLDLVSCPDIAAVYTSENPAGDDFLDAFFAIVSVLTASEQWQALPEWIPPEVLPAEG